jgi:3'(2'), 5'-bisphosphate nucleotidase
MIDSKQLQVLCDIARRAGDEIMAVYRTDFASWTKDDDSPLTQADLRSDAVIRSGLEEAFPNVFILSEESTSQASSASSAPSPQRRFFLVDPLDGTREFLKRNDEFTVNIALIDDGAPVAGVVFAPALDQLYFAAQGLGAFRRDPGGDVRLQPQAPAAGQSLRVIGSRSHGGEALSAWLQKLTVPHTFVAAGSSLKFCRLAEGAADIYPRHGPTSQWDTAAAQAVLECAGGAVHDPSGAPLRYGLERPVLNPFFIALAQAGMHYPPPG